MNNKLMFIAVIIILFAVITIFTTIVYAKGSDFLCPKKRSLIITLKNEAEINKSQNEILKIPHVKIIKIKYRDKEWSKLVNRMDLPNMENPFKNEFTIKVKKKADIDKIYNKIKEMSFVEDVKYLSDLEK